MKKKVLHISIIFFILMFVLFLFGTKSYAGSQKLNEIEYDVNLTTDGNAIVTETWNIRVSDTNTLFKTFELDSSKYGNITDVKVAEIINNGQRIEFHNTGMYAYHVEKNGFYALPTQESDFEIAWGVSIVNPQNRIYQITYKVEDVIKKYNDCSEFYWQFIGNTNGIPAKKVVGKITLPSEVSTRDNLKVWAHGPLNGNINIVDNKTVSFDVSNLQERTMVEVRIVTTESLFTIARNKINTNGLNNILEEETRWANMANAERNQRRMIDLVVILIEVIVIAVCVIIILRYVKELKNLKEVKPENETQYFRDFPDEDATPAEAAFLYYFKKKKSFDSNVSKIVSATILNLALKKVISFEQNEKGKVYIILNKEYKDDLKDDEKSIFDLLINVRNYIKEKNKIEENAVKISMDDIEKYADKEDKEFLTKINSVKTSAKISQTNKGNYVSSSEELYKKWKAKASRNMGEIMLIFYVIIMLVPMLSLFADILNIALIIPMLITFIIYPIVSSILCKKIANKVLNLTQKGTNEKEEWEGLERYMEDFSLLNEREVPELVLWEKYLVYATAFGIADKVLKQLKIVYPEFSNEEYMLNNGYSFMYIANRISMDRMLVSGIDRAYFAGNASSNARYSSYSGFSSGSGRWRRIL